MSKYVIEDGIPLPKRKGGPGSKPKYPFRQMDVGDSFLCRDVNQKTLSWAARICSKRHGMKFATRKVDGGVRVWRIA